MADTAEEALAAFARDLVEEIAAGRALELAADDPGAVGLAAFDVRAHLRRSPSGKVEQVREHTETRAPGTGWIPQPDWDKGQQEWEKAGEAAWKAREAARGLGEIHHPTQEQIPPPLKGASAVHPQLHGKHVTLPGDTLSGHGHAHVPRPFEVPAPTAQDKALGEAHAALEVHRQIGVRELEAKQAAARAERTGKPAPGTYAPLDDPAYADYVTHAEDVINAAYEQGMATNRTQTLEGNRHLYTPERAAVHKEIVQQALAKAAAVPSEGKGLMMGGLGGSGKSTVLKNAPDIDMSRYAVVNPDDIKAELAKRGLVPPLEGLSPMEASSLVHQESRHVANLVSRALMRRRKNVAFDITMNDQHDVRQRLDWFRHHGYRSVHGVFVDTPVETAVQRNLARHRKGLEAWRQGKGLGERLVPSYLIRSAEIAPGLTRNRAAFDATKHEFTGWQLWDNSGAKPKLVDQSAEQPAGGGITSVEDLMRQRQAKALDTSGSASAAEHGAAGQGAGHG